MELDELYQALQRLEDDGEIVNAYGGSEKDIDHPDGQALMDFADYICINYPGERPLWIETFYQVFNWQYSAMYEGADGYYANNYGEAPYHIIKSVEKYLNDNGYKVIAEQYTRGIVNCEKDKYPPGKMEIIHQIEKWIDWNTEAVWKFYLDILKKHKNDWLAI